METLFVAYLQNSVQLSVIALLMLALSPLSARRYSANCRYYLWAVFFWALIIPVRTMITLPMPDVFRPILPQRINAIASGTAAMVDTAKKWDWHLWVAGLLWAVGVFCFLGWNLFQHQRFLSAIRRWSEDIKDSALLKQFACIKAELGIRDPITIKSCACIKTPMVIGLLHPVVLLPQFDFSQDELPHILKHELVHYKRKDLWYKVVMMIASAIHWFNPVVHIMVRSVLTLCEISCDEKVLKEVDAKGRARYGEAIIGIVRNGSPYQTALSTNFYSGSEGMKKRIYAMMDMSKKRFSPVLFVPFFMFAICGTATFAWSPSPVGEISQDSSAITTVATDRGQTNPETSSAQSLPTPDIEPNDQGNQSFQDSVLIPVESEPVLIPAREGAPGEPVLKQTYDPDVSRLVIGTRQP